MLSAPEGLHRIKLLLPELFLVSARRRLQRLLVGRNWQRQWHEEGPGGALPLPHTASKARGADGAHPTCPRRGSFCKDGQVLASPLPYETLLACGGHGVEAGRQVFQAPWASTVGATSSFTMTTKTRTMAMWSYAVCERLRSACKMQKKYEKTGLFGKFGIWAQNMTKQQSKSEAQSFTLGGDCIIICLSSVLLWFRLVCGRWERNKIKRKMGKKFYFSLSDSFTSLLFMWTWASACTVFLLPKEWFIFQL